MRRRWGSICAISVVMAAGCAGSSGSARTENVAPDASPSGHHTAPPSPTAAAAPADAGFLNQPKTVTEPDGSQARVTLNGVAYKPNPNGDASTMLAVVDLSFTGVSAKPFRFQETDVYFSFSDQGSPYTHAEDDHTYGPDPTEDYTPYGPVQPLRSGSVAMGVTRRGLIILRMGTGPTPILLVLTKHADNLPAVLWALVSKNPA